MTYIRNYYKSILWACVVAVLLFIPGNKLPHSKLLNFENSDKLIHLFLFIVLEFLLILETWVKAYALKSRQIILLIIITLIFAASTELVQQYFIEERQGSIFDYLADFIGVVMAYGIYLLSRKTINRFYRPIS
jgi:VanZ family protein